MISQSIYLDYAATSPLDPDVLEAMGPYGFEMFANPSSPHQWGRQAHKALENARCQVADEMGCQPKQIVFNSGGTEGLNHAIMGIQQSADSIKNEIILSPIEHHAVLESVQFLTKQGITLRFCEVDAFGVVDVDHLGSLISERTAMICVMHANNEIGTLQPIPQIAQMAHQSQIPLIVDAVQTVGHISLDWEFLGADVLLCSAHKFCGPKGVGAMLVKPSLPMTALLKGGDQERGRRASTSNVMGIVGFAKALKKANTVYQEETKRFWTWREHLIKAWQGIDGLRFNGHPTQRLAHILHLTIPQVHAEDLLMLLDRQGVAASMGSACQSGLREPSHVLKAIGLSDEEAMSSFRFSFGRWTKDTDIDYLMNVLPKVVQQLRSSTRPS